MSFPLFCSHEIDHTVHNANLGIRSNIGPSRRMSVDARGNPQEVTVKNDIEITVANEYAQEESSDEDIIDLHEPLELSSTPKHVHAYENEFASPASTISVHSLTPFASPEKPSTPGKNIPELRIHFENSDVLVEVARRIVFQSKKQKVSKISEKLSKRLDTPGATPVRKLGKWARKKSSSSSFAPCYQGK